MINTKKKNNKIYKIANNKQQNKRTKIKKTRRKSNKGGSSKGMNVLKLIGKRDPNGVGRNGLNHTHMATSALLTQTHRNNYGNLRNTHMEKKQRVIGQNLHWIMEHISRYGPVRFRVNGKYYMLDKLDMQHFEDNANVDTYNIIVEKIDINKEQRVSDLRKEALNLKISPFGSDNNLLKRITNAKKKAGIEVAVANNFINEENNVDNLIGQIGSFTRRNEEGHFIFEPNGELRNFVTNLLEQNGEILFYNYLNGEDKYNTHLRRRAPGEE